MEGEDLPQALKVIKGEGEARETPDTAPDMPGTSRMAVMKRSFCPSYSCARCLWLRGRF